MTIMYQQYISDLHLSTVFVTTSQYYTNDYTPDYFTLSLADALHEQGFTILSRHLCYVTLVTYITNIALIMELNNT